MSKTRVWYHGSCRDGFTAAYCAWLALGDDAVYVPVSHNRKTLPDHDPGDVVYILDFSYERPVIDGLLANLGPDGQLVILDHHASAERELADLDCATFDMSKSGAMLAWEYFHGECPALLVQYVQDRDLWLHEMPDTHEMNALVSITPMTFRAWGDLHDVIGFDVPRARAEGGAILAARNALVERIQKTRRWQVVAGHKVPTVNTSVLQSEVCAKMVRDYPLAAFAVAYFTGANGDTMVSLRSVGDFDVSEVAARFGGGGHKNAAGYSFKPCNPGELTPPIQIVINWRPIGMIAPRGES